MPSSWVQVACLSPLHDKLRCEYAGLGPDRWCAYCQVTHEQYFARIHRPTDDEKKNVRVFVIDKRVPLEQDLIDNLLVRKRAIEMMTEEFPNFPKFLRRYLLQPAEHSDIVIPSGDSAARDEEMQ